MYVSKSTFEREGWAGRVKFAVELTGVSRTFGLAPAVVKVNLRVERGECLWSGG